MKYKICSKCKKKLSISCFHKNKYNRDGLQSQCKNCRNKNVIPNLPFIDGYKYCNECHKELPATTEYFHKSKKGYYGLHGQCRLCRSKKNKDYLIRSGKVTPKPIPKEGYKFCTVCNQELPLTFKYFYKNQTSCIECVRKKRLGDDWKPLPPKPDKGNKICKDCGNELPATIGYFNHHKTAKYDLSTRCRNCEKEFKRNWRENNTDLIIRYTKKYNSTEKGKMSLKKGRRKAKSRRRDFNYVELFENPFDKSEEIEWHHIDDKYVVALPKDLHHLYCGKFHRDNLMVILKQIYPEVELNE